MNDQVRTLIAQALSIAPDKVSQDTSLTTTSAWDSLAHFRLVLALEEVLARKLSPPEILALTDVQAVAHILNHQRG